MSPREYRITNITQGRLELSSYRTVLGPGESVVLMAPLADDIMWFKGEQKISIDLVPEGSKQPVATPSVAPQGETKKSKKSN